MVKKYGWKSLSRWDVWPLDAYIRYEKRESGISKAICAFMLVKRTDQGGGYWRCEYIKKDKVTPKILRMAEKI